VAMTWSAARFFGLASVRRSVAPETSNAARPTFFGTGARAASFQWKRPATIRWTARKGPPSSSKTTRFPRRRKPRIAFPSALESGGATVRRRNGEATRTLSSVRPASRRVRCST